jgi:Family of unknown function (DUF6959)
MFGRSKNLPSGRHPNMDAPKIAIEVFGDETNAAVVRMPGRNFPGYVLQSDSLNNLLYWAKEAYEEAKRIEDKDLIVATGNVLAKVQEMMDIYSAVVDGFVKRNKPPAT